MSSLFPFLSFTREAFSALCMLVKSNMATSGWPAWFFANSMSGNMWSVEKSAASYAYSCRASWLTFSGASSCSASEKSWERERFWSRQGGFNVSLHYFSCPPFALQYTSCISDRTQIATVCRYSCENAVTGEDQNSWTTVWGLINLFVSVDVSWKRVETCRKCHQTPLLIKSWPLVNHF